MNYLLIKFPNPILKKASEKVQAFSTDELRALVRDMTETMYSNRGIGLAANQIGVRLNVFVLDIGEGPKAFCNCTITKSYGELQEVEGCLSVDHIHETVKRFEKVDFDYQDVDGASHKGTAEGLFARAIQHETDHLAGKLFIDRLSPLKRELAFKRAKKLAQFSPQG